MRSGRILARIDRRFVAIGERYLALPGVLFILTGVLLVGCSGWWSYRDRVENHAAEVGRRIESAGTWIASATSLHGDESPTAFHRLVLETVQDPWIDRARVSLAGRVIASSVLEEIDQSLAVLRAADSASDDLYSVVKRGSIGEDYVVEVWGDLGVQPGMASAMTPALWIGGVGLAVMLVVYRVSRQRFGAIGAVSQALRSHSRGEQAAEALRVDPGLGEVATAWNQVLDEHEQLRIGRLVARTHEAESDLNGTSTGLISVAVGAMPLGVVIYGPGQSLRYANNAAENMLGSLNRGAETSDDEQVGFTDEAVSRAIEAAASGGSRSRWSTEINLEDSQDTVFRVTVRPLNAAGESAAMVLIEDVTKQRLAEHARASFLARATHELRTPLTNIRLYAEQATEENESNPAERNRALNVINQESRRLERLVGDMLSSAEIENGSLAVQTNDLRLDAFFKEIENDYRAQAEQRGIALRFELPPKLPVIQADREKLALAMHNLIGNALKYNTRGGWVEVRFEIGTGDEYRFSVKDNGFGISEEDQKRLFDPYFRSSDDRIQHITGSGIGLGLARDVAKLHGGEIQVESAIDKGSEFTLRIPGESSQSQAA